MVSVASIPHASGWRPRISKPDTLGIRSSSQTWGFTVRGAAVPVWLPINRNAGPAPAISIRAVPSPHRATGPVSDNTISMGRVTRYVPAGKYTERAAAMARMIASVSSVCPSPRAPNDRTSRQSATELPSGFEAGPATFSSARVTASHNARLKTRAATRLYRPSLRSSFLRSGESPPPLEPSRV